MEKAKQLWGWLNQTRIMRANARYGKARGGLLAGGIAYSALFSITAALTIAWTVFMATLGGNARLRSDVIKAINQVLPGILQDGSGSGMINPDSLVMDSALNPASVIAALVLLWSAIGIMSNIRASVQAMFGIVAPPMNMVQEKARDLFGFVAMALGIVTSSVLGTAATTMGGKVMEWLGLEDSPGSSYVLRVVGILVAAVVAAGTFALLFRVTAAVKPLRRDLVLGSLIGGIVVQIILILSTSLVSSISDNALLAASASIASLLLMVNILSRVLLYVAAFTANPPAPVPPGSKAEVHYDERPNYVTESAEHTLAWPHQDVTGQLDPDPSLRPELSDDEGHQLAARPDGKPIPASTLPWYSALWTRAKAQQRELDVVELRARLGERPRMDEAEERYWAERDAAQPPSNARSAAR